MFNEHTMNIPILINIKRQDFSCLYYSLILYFNKIYSSIVGLNKLLPAISTFCPVIVSKPETLKFSSNLILFPKLS